jgi:ectoine hydroxylase-related dioxygenase (phytanoyl-CoA dioxygenase family)
MFQVPDLISKEDFLKAYNEDGFVVVKGNFDPALLEKFRKAMLELIEVERELLKKDKTYRDYGFLLCALYYLDRYPFLLDVFDNSDYLKYVEWILDKYYIMHLYSCNCLLPGKNDNKAGDIHVDSPRIMPEGYHNFVATMINLDDYTADNGATWILPASQKYAEMPDREFFFKHGIQLTVPKGSICFFNPRVWHATGINQSNDWRTCLLIAFCKPWMKQRVDVPKFIRHIAPELIPDRYRQLLGFQSQPPTTFEEFYGELESRTYTQPYV